MEIVAPLFGLGALMAASLYTFAAVVRNAGIIDIFWGIMIAVYALFASQLSTSPHVTLLAVVTLISIWGVRLAVHIARRKIGKPEDWRYARWRKDWGSSYPVRSLLQALLAMIMAAPAIVAALSDSPQPLTALAYAGIAIWTAGFIIEVIADYQLDDFLKHRRTSKNSIMTEGIWSWSRHPNYFGEVIQWWGLWLVVVHLSYGWFALVSPVLITTLILFVSGIPLLEKKYAKDKAFQVYAKRTSLFVPLPPKKSKP